MNTETPETVFDAFTIFSKTEEHQDNTSLINNLRSGLRKYVMPSYGFTAQELRKLDIALTKLPLEKFKNVEELLTSEMTPLVEAGKLAGGTFSGYKSALSRFINWLREQGD